MSVITIIGLGPWGQGELTGGAAQHVQGAHVLARTQAHAACAQLKRLAAAFETLDGLYDRHDDFDSLHRALAQAVLAAAAQGDVVYAVPGSALVGEPSACLLGRLAKGTHEVRVIPAAEEHAPLLAHAVAQGQCVDACTLTPAAQLPGLRVDTRIPLVVTQIDSMLGAGECKLRLARLYGDEAQVLLYNAAHARWIALYELDRQAHYALDTMLYLPPAAPGQGDWGLYGLVELMRTLRGAQGCPWDREQTHTSLRPYMIEEAYEVVEAIDTGDPDALCDELGDVLLQVVFHADVARQHDTFDIEDIANAICNKMVQRHPHIFAAAQAHTAADVSRSWESIKKQEKGIATDSGMMRDLPHALPALIHAMKVQQKAARVGFDWPDASGALSKLREETAEVTAAMRSGDAAALHEELGDLLFAAVNLLRLLDVHPELTLRAATAKFIHRFEWMETAAHRSGRALRGMTLAELDKLWNEAKNH